MREVEARNGGTFHVREKGDPALPGAGRPPQKNIIEEVTKLMEGDGYTIVEGELLDESGKRTGKMVKVRASVPNMASAARAYAANMKKGDVRTLQIYLERTQGKVKDIVDMNFRGQSVQMSFNTDALSVEELRSMTEILTKATAQNEE
jgi:hypothetical protein